jgi:hypothetical protein
MKINPLIFLFILIFMATQFLSHADSKIWNKKSHVGYAVKWAGQCKNGKAEGIGSLEWLYNKRHEGRYDGNYTLGKMYGHGTYAMDNGSRYIGDSE